MLNNNVVEKKNKADLIHMKNLTNFQLMNDALAKLGVNIRSVDFKDMEEALWAFEHFISAANNLK